MAQIIEITNDTFDSEVLQAQGTVLVDFWAGWCGPCRMLAPVIQQIADEEHPGLKVCKINVDDQPALAQQFEIMTIPTLKVFKEGAVVEESVGVIPKPAILKMVGLS